MLDEGGEGGSSEEQDQYLGFSGIPNPPAGYQVAFPLPQCVPLSGSSAPLSGASSRCPRAANREVLGLVALT